MRRTVTYRTTSATVAQPPAPQAQPEPRRDELSVRIRAALVAGLAVFCGAFVLLGGIYALIAIGIDASSKTLWIGIAVAAGLAFLAALYTSCSLLYRWSVRVGEYDWNADADERDWHHWFEEDERDHRRQWERDERDWQRQQAEREQEAHAPRLTPIDTLRVNAFTLLSRHYDGKPTTRKAVCGVDVAMSQPEWNLANKVFRVLGWKEGQTLDPGPSLEAAWAHWLHHIRIHGTHVQQRVGDSKNWHDIK